MVNHHQSWCAIDRLTREVFHHSSKIHLPYTCNTHDSLRSLENRSCALFEGRNTIELKKIVYPPEGYDSLIPAKCPNIFTQPAHSGRMRHKLTFIPGVPFTGICIWTKDKNFGPDPVTTVTLVSILHQPYLSLVQRVGCCCRVGIPGTGRLRPTKMGRDVYSTPVSVKRSKQRFLVLKLTVLPMKDTIER